MTGLPVLKKFPRSTKPKNYSGKPMLIGFFDGSLRAYDANVYVRWELSEPDENGRRYFVQLLCAKAKITPMNGCTIPKSELNGATLLSRLLKAASRAMVDTPETVLPVGDSQCVIASLEMSSSKFKPFFMNRISEIRDNLDQIKSVCSVEDFHFIPGKQNPADLATRTDGKLKDIGMGSVWQSPGFLSEERKNWPISRDFLKNELPLDEMNRKSLVSFLKVEINPVENRVKENIEEICKYSDDLDKVLRIIALQMRASDVNTNFSIMEEEKWLDLAEKYQKSKIKISKNTSEKVKSINKSAKESFSKLPKKEAVCDFIEKFEVPLEQSEINKAERLLLLFAMEHTRKDLEANMLTSLLPFEDKRGIIYTRGKVGEKALQRILGVDKLPILSPKSRLARLIMIRAHEEGTHLDHRGVASTLAKSRTRAWITQGGKLAKSVVNSCNHCKLNLRKPQAQQMALIRDEQLQPCPPFTHVCLDYMGPLMMHDEIKKRVTMKVWVLVYCCRSTRAVCLLAVPGYDTDKFLLRHREFVFRYGDPQSIVSDRGTSLVKAGMVLDADNHPSNWNWKKVVESNKTTKWIFTEIGCQWRNGLSEALVKITKKCLKAAVPDDIKITYSELITLLAQISYTINCRPIGVFGGNDLKEEMQPITPNMLLIGRSDMDCKVPEYDMDTALPKRTAYVKNLVDKWWSSWIKQVFPQLILCKKWRNQVRNLEVGDICLLFYPGSLTGKYKLVKVVEVHPDNEGKVRTVSIIYKKRNKKEKSEEIFKNSIVKEKVGVQRLILIQPISDQQVSGPVQGQAVQGVDVGQERHELQGGQEQ